MDTINKSNVILKNFTDEELVRKIQLEKDSKATLEIMRRYKPLVLSRIPSLKRFHNGTLLNHEDVKSILEITFFSLLKEFPIDNDQLKFAGWISLRLMNRSARYGGSYKKSFNTFKQEGAVYIDELLQPTIHNDDNKNIDEAIEKLETIKEIIKSNHRIFNKKEILLLKGVLDKKDINKISKEMNITKEAAYKITYVARNKLKSLMY